MRDAAGTREGLLVLDPDLLFSSRLHEIARRDRVVVPYRNQMAAHGSSEGFRIDADEILALAEHRGLSTIVLTSESLLYPDDDESALALIHEIRRLSARSSRKVVLVAFRNPLQAIATPRGGIEVRIAGRHNRAYGERLAQLQSVLDPTTSLVFACSAYLTHGESVRQANPAMELANPDGFVSLHPHDAQQAISIAPADTLIHALFTVLHHTGEVQHQSATEPSTLAHVAASWARSRRRGTDSKLGPSVNGPSGVVTTGDSDTTSVYHQINCSLKLLYRKSPAERLGDGHVADVRMRLGASLADSLPEVIRNDLELIVPVPETGKYYAQGVAQHLRVPYLEALYKKAEIGRSFDIQDHATRREFINAKLGIIPSMVAGKSIAIVDEAIFTGATLKLVAHLLQATAVRNVYLLVASPECKARCPFNMQPERPHLSEYVRDVDLAAYFDVTGVFFQEQLVYHRTMHDSRHGCTVCFTAS